jgi:REP element-mobilizing transposase RayT
LTFDKRTGSLSDMPSRNEIKDIVPDSIYHAYNRGVERRRIFLETRDYHRFLAQLRQSLHREPSIELLAYCLMPNHFHLLLRQSEGLGMSRFMQRVSIAYVMYFNKKYRRVGPLFQGKYKAASVIDQHQLMEASRYIHLNPERAGLDWHQHAYSSRRQYLGDLPDGMVNPAPVLDLFDKPEDYWYYLNRRRNPFPSSSSDLERKTRGA